jgi:hypothetical protein
LVVPAASVKPSEKKLMAVTSPLDPLADVSLNAWNLEDQE